MATTPHRVQKWKPPKDDSKSVLFVRSELDEYGLDVYEFRVLAHVARREGKTKQGTSRGCFAKQKTIAEICDMSHRKAQSALSVLCDAGLLEKQSQRGSTNIYRVAPPSKWKDPKELPKIREKYSSSKKTTTSENLSNSLDDSSEDLPF
jgi:predicted transcriptional regulator